MVFHFLCHRFGWRFFRPCMWTRLLHDFRIWLCGRWNWIFFPVYFFARSLSLSLCVCIKIHQKSTQRENPVAPKTSGYHFIRCRCWKLISQSCIINRRLRAFRGALIIRKECRIDVFVLLRTPKRVPSELNLLSSVKFFKWIVFFR